MEGALGDLEKEKAKLYSPFPENMDAELQSLFQSVEAEAQNGNVPAQYLLGYLGALKPILKNPDHRTPDMVANILREMSREILAFLKTASANAATTKSESSQKAWCANLNKLIKDLGFALGAPTIGTSYTLQLGNFVNSPDTNTKNTISEIKSWAVVKPGANAAYLNAEVVYR